jgi:hypothetical protein
VLCVLLLPHSLVQEISDAQSQLRPVDLEAVLRESMMRCGDEEGKSVKARPNPSSAHSTPRVLERGGIKVDGCLCGRLKA